MNKKKFHYIGLFLLINVSITALAQSSSQAEAESLCKSQEINLFSCAVENSTKFVSLCGSKILSRKKGYVKYRFGRPDKLELEFPKELLNTQREFKYAHYYRYQINRTEVGFSIGKYRYFLYEYYDGEETPIKNESGILVIFPSGQKRQLPCTKDIYGSLSNLELIAICDVENPLNIDNCSTR